MSLVRKVEHEVRKSMAQDLSTRKGSARVCLKGILMTEPVLLLLPYIVHQL